LLHRVILSAEVRHEQDLLVRVEALSASTSGFDGTPPPTQDDPADILQAYVETGFEAGGGRVPMRARRPELTLGSSRLVSVRESPNVRRSFDGLRATWSSPGSLKMDAFFVRPVSPESGNFDDSSSRAQQFWGLYATVKLPGHEKLALDAYYLGL